MPAMIAILKLCCKLVEDEEVDGDVAEFVIAMSHRYDWDLLRLKKVDSR